MSSPNIRPGSASPLAQQAASANTSSTAQNHTNDFDPQSSSQTQQHTDSSNTLDLKQEDNVDVEDYVMDDNSQRHQQQQQQQQEQQQQEPEVKTAERRALEAAGLTAEDGLPTGLEKRDISLREFISKMDDYAPIIPDAVTAHALTLAGLPPPNLHTHNKPSAPSDPSNANSQPEPSQPVEDPNVTPLRLSRLLALATQKFIADVAADAYQYSRMRSANLTSNTLAPTNAMSLPTTGPGAAAGAGGGGAGASGAGAAGDAKGKGTGQHVLGMQRPGFGGGGQGGGQGRTVLTMEDLGMAVGEWGVSVRRGEFYR